MVPNHVLHRQLATTRSAGSTRLRQWRGRHSRTQASRLGNFSNLVPSQPVPLPRASSGRSQQYQPRNKSALLLVLKYVADNREEFVNNFSPKSKRSVAKRQRPRASAAWIIPNDGSRPALVTAQLARLLRAARGQRSTGSIGRRRSRFRARARRRTAGSATCGRSGRPSPRPRHPSRRLKVEAGSFVVRMDQPRTAGWSI